MGNIFNNEKYNLIGWKTLFFACAAYLIYITVSNGQWPILLFLLIPVGMVFCIPIVGFVVAKFIDIGRKILKI